MLTTISTNVLIKKILPKGIVTNYAPFDINFHIDARINSFNQITKEVLALNTGIASISITDSTIDTDGIIIFTVPNLRIGITRFDIMYANSGNLDGGLVSVERIGSCSVKRIEATNEVEV